jgi:hypothetical protein
MGPPQRFVVGFRGREELCAGSASSVLSLWGGPIQSAPSPLSGLYGLQAVQTSSASYVNVGSRVPVL